ncbi:MAG: neocarzinostatin apoprotein domain-containing protein [Acidimicrobiales bacterium]
MSRVRNFRVAVSVVVMSVGVLAGGVVGVTTASAKTTPKLVVKPAVNLKNGEKVTVSGSGFKPGDMVYFVECLRTAKGQAGCNTPAGIPPYATISSTGTFPTFKFKVTTGKVGTGTCGTKTSNLAKCAVSAGNATGGDSAVADITFAAKK